MENTSFDLNIYTFYKERLEEIQKQNHWGIEQICVEIPLSYRTYKKLVSLDPNNDISLCSLRKIKKFIEKNF